jgi:hypothetical protein
LICISNHPTDSEIKTEINDGHFKLKLIEPAETRPVQDLTNTQHTSQGGQLGRIEDLGVESEWKVPRGLNSSVMV